MIKKQIFKKNPVSSSSLSDRFAYRERHASTPGRQPYFRERAHKWRSITNDRVHLSCEHAHRIVAIGKFPTRNKMLDLFAILTKGGLVLWCLERTPFSSTLSSVNSLIRDVILQVRRLYETFTLLIVTTQYSVCGIVCGVVL